MKKLSFLVCVVTCCVFFQTPLSQRTPKAILPTLNGVHMHYLTEGKGAAVILLHGYAESSICGSAYERTWQDPHGHRTGLRGGGQSSTPPMIRQSRDAQDILRLSTISASTY